MNHKPHLRLVAARDQSLTHLVEGVSAMVETGEVKYAVALLEMDDGSMCWMTSSMDRPQLVWILHQALHDALIPEEDSGAPSAS